MNLTHSIRLKQGLKKGLFSLGLSFLLAACQASKNESTSSEITPQVHLPLIKRMPNFPEPYHMRDWQKVTKDFDAFLYDLNTKGEHLPLMKVLAAELNPNDKEQVFGFTSYVGPIEKHKHSFEAIAVIGSVLSASFAGIDKSSGKYNWASMCQQYFNKGNGRNLVLNMMDTDYDSFWYTVFPHILFYSLSDRYPGTGEMDNIMRITADKWYEAAYIMGGSENPTGFNFTYFDFDTKQPKYNDTWREPDSSAGIAWLMYSAYLKFDDPKYLQAAQWCLQDLDDKLLKENPYYEIQLPFGAYTAVRMNAEQGTHYDASKFINWSFEHSSQVRADMGVVHKRWLEHDCHGLVGSLNRLPWRSREGGYAFAMNTFAMAWPFVSMLRYDDRYADSIGKWMLNAANASRLFYGGFHPPERQSSPQWKEDKNNAVAYEGLRQLWDKDEQLFASGDAVNHNWGYATDHGLYGSSYVGIYGAIIKKTNQKYILQLDCLATDVFANKAYPTYLYFNPYESRKKVILDLPQGDFDIYETRSNEFLARHVSGKTELELPANSSIVIILAPAGGKLTRDGHKTLINDVIVDYR
ncbi:hypothetical protein PQO03_14285 [Lentisphaera profundi]|uniref:Uncharacterized protein n=1 Tax=Lentisphaera profundi TaxID=1658616 RepID=A0ABY7VXS0_9BACT|nr:hypothetical protein [Lentisphaera profundi]WDE99003.1 hypothetical protein PQO03_14285 [Lentisphaera profundi]